MLPKRLEIITLTNKVASSEGDNLFFTAELSTDKTEDYELSGVYAEWYESNEGCQPYGMRVDRHSDKIQGIQLAEMHARQEGVALGRVSVIERSGWGVLYGKQSFLTNGAIVTSYLRKEPASPDMPERVMTIVAETERALLATAALIGLPLEDKLAVETQQITS